MWLLTETRSDRRLEIEYLTAGEPHYSYIIFLCFFLSRKRHKIDISLLETKNFLSFAFPRQTIILHFSSVSIL